MHKSHFYTASPDKKPQVVANGFEFISTSVDQVTLNLKILSAWVKGMPDLMLNGECELPNAKTIRAYEDYIRACDAMMAEIVASSEHMQRVMDTTKSLRHVRSTSKVIPRE